MRDLVTTGDLAGELHAPDLVILDSSLAAPGETTDMRTAFEHQCGNVRHGQRMHDAHEFSATHQFQRDLFARRGGRSFGQIGRQRPSCISVAQRGIQQCDDAFAFGQFEQVFDRAKRITIPCRPFAAHDCGQPIAPWVVQSGFGMHHTDASSRPLSGAAVDIWNGNRMTRAQ